MFPQAVPVRISSSRGIQNLGQVMNRGVISFHDDVVIREQLSVPAELVLRTVESPRFREGLAERVASLPDFGRFSIETPLEITAQGNRDAFVIWTLPAPEIQRLSFIRFRWVRDEEAAARTREVTILLNLRSAAHDYLMEQSDSWAEAFRADAELQVEITRRSLAIRRASGDRLRVSPSWRFGRDEDWDARTARFEGHLAELARLAALVRELPPSSRVHEILLEGTPERPGERRIGAEVDTAEELRDFLARSNEVELRARALRAAEERIEAATGIACTFGQRGTRPAGAQVPDLEALASGLSETGILERDVAHLTYREDWTGWETTARVRIEISFPGVSHIAGEDLSVGTDPTELLDRVRAALENVPRVSREVLKRRAAGAPSAAGGLLVGEREIAREIAIRTTVDAGLWEVLDPALPNHVRFEERTVTVTLEGRSTGEIAIQPAETLTERLHQAYAPLHAASDAARRRAGILAERNRLETEALGGAIEIEPDPRITTDGLERALVALAAALDLETPSAEPAGAPVEPWYRRVPFWKIEITPRESGWGTAGRPGSGFLDRPTRDVLRIPVDATPEQIAAWLAAPPE